MFCSRFLFKMLERYREEHNDKQVNNDKTKALNNLFI